MALIRRKKKGQNQNNLNNGNKKTQQKQLDYNSQILLDQKKMVRLNSEYALNQIEKIKKIFPNISSNEFNKSL